jgi:hypothetical protein
MSAVAHRAGLDVQVESAAGEAPGTARRHRFVGGELPVELQESALRLEPRLERRARYRGDKLLELDSIGSVESRESGIERRVRDDRSLRPFPSEIRVSPDMVEVPVRIEDGAGRGSGVDEEPKELIGMLPAAACVDDHPAVGSAEENAVSVGTTVRGELPWDEDDAGGNLRPHDQKRC